jgi:hypothetical protein
MTTTTAERLRANLHDFEAQIEACKDDDDASVTVAPVPTDAPPDGLFDGLVRLVEAQGYTFSFDTFPDGQSNAVAFADDGLTDHGNRTITIRSGLVGWQRVNILTHELAHVLLMKHTRYAYSLSNEIEAESITALVCHAYGLRSRYSAEWIAAKCSWWPDEPVHASRRRIIEAAGSILDAVAEVVTA